MQQISQEQLERYRALQKSAVLRKISDILVFVIYQVIRSTVVWFGAWLVDLPSWGLPAISWVQALGIVMMIRPLVTQVIGVQQQVDTASVMNQANAALFQVAQSMVGQENNDAAGE